MSKLCVALLPVLAACGTPGPTGTDVPVGPETPTTTEDAFPLAAEAVVGISDPSLATLLRDHWDWTMRTSPVWATTRGDHRFDSLIANRSHEAVQKQDAERKSLLDRARALSADKLDAIESVTLKLFVEQQKNRLGTSVCESHLWQVSAFGNPITGSATIAEMHKIKGDADAASLISRYQKLPAWADAAIANLKRGADAGLYANAESIRRALVQIDGVLAKPTAEWALMKPAADAKVLAVLSPEVASSFPAELFAIVDGDVKAAFARYRAFLHAEILPKARGPKEVGIGALPVGKACYQAKIRQHLGLERTADQLHQLGLTEIKRINDEMRALGKKLFDTGDLAAITTRLRTDPTLFYKSADEIVAAAEAALADAKAAMGDAFGITPKADCIVTPIPEHEAPFSTIAYYREPHADGSVPGQFFINTYKPEVRPRFEMRVLAYHEAIPGHHLQIAISQERDSLPAFRRHAGTTAFVEGWALYTERLADEMGLYKSDLDRMGMLSYDAWRASRLVVDTGIHAKGWTREQAEEFLREHTALTGENIRNETDRYISWPGQALAYKVGQLEIFRLREDAKKRLGARFDIKAFHDVVLSSGGVSLPVLGANVEAWVASFK